MFSKLTKLVYSSEHTFEWLTLHQKEQVCHSKFATELRGLGETLQTWSYLDRADEAPVNERPLNLETRAFCAPAQNVKTTDCSLTSDLNWLINHKSEWTASIYTTIIKWPSTRPWMIFIQTMNEENGRFYMSLNAFLSPELIDAWILARICPIKADLMQPFDSFSKCFQIVGIKPVYTNAVAGAVNRPPRMG